jgi:Phage Tail Collar Domain
MQVPIGTIIAFGADTKNVNVVAELKKQGWLLCDGSYVSERNIGIFSK